MNAFKNIVSSGVADKVEIPLNVTSKTCGPEQIKIVFGDNKEYNEEDDTELVKQIKATGILDSDDIVHKNGYMMNKTGSILLDIPYLRESNYKQMYIKKRDVKTKQKLENDDQIHFILLPEGKTLDDFDNLDDDADLDEYQLRYDKFVKNEMKIDGLNLALADEIVLESSYCNILFDYPNFQSNVAFTVHADDDMKGFTRKELALKAMQRFHMLWYLCTNYDMEKGCVIQKDVTNIPIREMPFRPTLYLDEYTDNGLLYLLYKKETNQWIFSCCDYI